LNNNQSNKEESSEPTVDDLVPVLRELEARVSSLEVALKHHEHNARGEPVIRL